MTVHRFEPDHYFNTIGSHPPVLRVAPGDTIITTTVDAGGHDASGERVTARPNPQTGPFYIEGAEPGDALVVHFERMTPNRGSGYTKSVLAPNVVDPEFAQQLPEEIASLAQWRVDLDAGTVTPDTPIPGLERLTLPLGPMLGCFGVAPPGGQAISTTTSGVHGGNMDYRGFTEGMTAYLPVFVPGALFHLGDGHALQGDGEIVGTGIEISMEVQFTVELRTGWSINWPRGENDDYIFTVGNARPLDQALQHATTEMVHWLRTDYQLDARAASTLLGQCVEYDVGNVFNPAYTMICKLPKRVLRALAGEE